MHFSTSMQERGVKNGPNVENAPDRVITRVRWGFASGHQNLEGTKNPLVSWGQNEEEKEQSTFHAAWVPGARIASYGSGS